MIQIKKKADCCGCTACASICPKDAIIMEPDTLGFKYPKVDLSKCIDCGLCEKVCAFNDNYDKSLNLKEPEIYAARHKDIHELETSRSGAVFIAISDYILENGGIVYGVGYKDHFRVAHKRATTKEERNEFKGSKYVQSDLDGIFRQVKEDLKQGNTVLFSGTPCQTAGLNSYIGKKLRENLVLVDIVCNGVPSPYIWRDYLSYIEKKNKSKVVKVNFRDKSRIGWSGHIESYTFDNGKKIETKKYTNLFYKHIMLRESCGICHFTNFHRPSDFTLADYWGWEKANININSDNKGVSLFIINTQKGINIFTLIKDKLKTIPTQQTNCKQPNLLHPSILHINRYKFIRYYKNNGFEYILHHNFESGFYYKTHLLNSWIKEKFNRISKKIHL